MWTSDKECFEKIKDGCGSTYGAVNLIAKRARIKLKEVDNMILESQAITWATTGIPPEIHENRNKCDVSTIRERDLNELLSYVDDEDVCESVKISYSKSLECHHLIYEYINISDESRKSRVRILTRMVWDSFHIK